GERGRARNFARPACASHPRKLVDSIDPSALRASRSSPCTYLICGSWGLELCAGHVIEQMGSSTLRNPWAKLQSVRFKRKGFRAQEGRLGGWLPHTSAFLEVFQRTGICWGTKQHYYKTGLCSWPFVPAAFGPG